MKLLTLALIGGGAWLLLGHKAKAAPVVTIAAPTGPQLIPSTPGSIIQAAPGAIPGVKGAGSGSPIETAGYIPPVVQEQKVSAVQLGRIGLAGCGCGGRCGGGLGSAPAERKAVAARLVAANATFRPLVQAAIRSGDRASIRQAATALGNEIRAASADYYARNPQDRSTRLAPSVAPVFMGPTKRGI